MRHKVLARFDDISTVIGALAFSVLLIIDLQRPGAHPAWIVFDAAMLVYCLGHMIAWLPVIDELRGVIVKALIGELVGLTLACAFFYFAVGSANVLQLLLAIAITFGGLWLLISSAKRMRDVHRAIKYVKGE